MSEEECSLFLARCMDHEKFELQTLFESIFQLNGDAFIADDGKRIELEMNPKEPELMDKLNKGLRILNTMNICDPDGRSIQFNMQGFIPIRLAAKSGCPKVT